MSTCLLRSTSIWQIFWHSIWHIFWLLSDISSGILSGISSGIYSDISSGILSGISSGISSEALPAFTNMTWCCSCSLSPIHMYRKGSTKRSWPWLRSGREHWALVVVECPFCREHWAWMKVEVRQRTLWIASRS